MAEEVRIIVRAEDSFSGVLGNFGNIITGIRSAISLAADAFRTFTDFAGQGLDAIASYERLSLTLETLAAREALTTGEAENMAEALKITAGQSEVLLNWMQELAIKSPFTLEGVANAFRLAQAYGFTAEEAQRLTQAMIDFAAGSGASEQTMSMIALALGQIQAKGKLAGQEVLQLVNAGLPVTQILAEAFGVTTAEITKMQTEGLLPAQKVIEAITEYLETNFAGAAQRQAESWAGLQGTFEDLKQMGLREFFGGLFEALQPLAIELSNWLQGPGLEQLREWGDALGAITSRVIEIGMALAGLDWSSFGAISDTITQSIRDVDWGVVSEEIATAIDNVDWSGVGQKFGEGIKTAMELAFTEGGEVQWFELLTAPIVAAGEFLAGWFAGFWNVEVSGSFDEALAQWGNFFTGLSNTIKNWFAGLGPNIKNWIADHVNSNIADIFAVIVTVMSDMAANISSGIQDIASVLVDAFSNIGAYIVSSIAAGIQNAPIGIILSTLFNLASMIVNTVKSFFGIASPSTVFAQIGRDLIQGLINGISSMLSSISSVIQSIVNALLAPLAPVLDLLGIDLGGSTGTGYGGRFDDEIVGGVTGGTGGLSSGVVNNYYYGPVYFGAAGEPGAYYDCPSPNPLMTASAGTLSTH